MSDDDTAEVNCWSEHGVLVCPWCGTAGDIRGVRRTVAIRPYLGLIDRHPDGTPVIRRGEPLVLDDSVERIECGSCGGRVTIPEAWDVLDA